MARYQRGIGDVFAAQNESSRTMRTAAMTVPALAPIESVNLGPDLSADLETLRIDLDANAKELNELGDIGEKIDQAASDLLDVHGRLTNEILPAISDAAASPITDARLAAGSLTVWPFQEGAVPAGGLAPGSVGSGEIADFAIAVTKLKSARHHLY